MKGSKFALISSVSHTAIGLNDNSDLCYGPKFEEVETKQTENNDRHSGWALTKMAVMSAVVLPFSTFLASTVVAHEKKLEDVFSGSWRCHEAHHQFKLSLQRVDDGDYQGIAEFVKAAPQTVRGKSNKNELFFTRQIGHFSVTTQATAIGNRMAGTARSSTGHINDMNCFKMSRYEYWIDRLNKIG